MPTRSLNVFVQLALNLFIQSFIVSENATYTLPQVTVTACHVFNRLVASLPSYHKKSIKAFLRARLEVAGHLSTTPR